MLLIKEAKQLYIEVDGLDGSLKNNVFAIDATTIDCLLWIVHGDHARCMACVHDYMIPKRRVKGIRQNGNHFNIFITGNRMLMRLYHRIKFKFLNFGL